MKKIKFGVLAIIFVLGLFSIPYLYAFECGTCSVSSNHSENIGKCYSCVGGEGDACIDTWGGAPSCSGESDDRNPEE